MVRMLPDPRVSLWVWCSLQVRVLLEAQGSGAQIYSPKYSSREGLSARGGRAGTEADPPPDTPGMAGSRLLPVVRVVYGKSLALLTLQHIRKPASAGFRRTPSACQASADTGG